MKKCIWTLDIDNYAPEITKITYPLMKRYARKCDAEFRIITERKYPGFPALYEKIQLYELGEQYDWNIFLDADAFIGPDMFDPTNHITPDTVAQHGNAYGVDIASNRWQYDRYFRRDGRHIGTCGWFSVVSRDCLDFYHPLEDMSYEQALERIWPSRAEQAAGLDLGHFIDDYVASRNVARYGLKFTSLRPIYRDTFRVQDGDAFCYHTYMVPEDVKLAEMKFLMERAGLQIEGDNVCVAQTRIDISSLKPAQ